jgi:hypothetical protein
MNVLVLLFFSSTLSPEQIPAVELQARLDRAAPGQVIDLPAARIMGTIVIRTPVTLLGRGRDQTVIDGLERDSTVVVLADSGEVRLEALTVTGGFARPVLTEKDFKHGTRNSFRLENGGGVKMLGGCTLEIVDVRVTGNRAHFGGGGIGAVTRKEGTLRIVRSEIRSNVAHEGFGGGIHLFSNGSVEILDSIIAENRAHDTGGAAILFRSTESGSARIVRTRFENNDSERRETYHLTLSSRVHRLEQVSFSPVSGSAIAIEENARVIAQRVAWPDAIVPENVTLLDAAD